MLKKTISILLLMAMCLSLVLLTSCGGDEESSSMAEVSTGEGFPLEEKNWGGETITIYTFEKDGYGTYEIAGEVEDAESTDAVQDAFYDRNALIEAKYGLKIEALLTSNYNTMIDDIRIADSTGIQDFQAVCCALTYVATAGVEGLLHDFNDLPYIDSSREWWDQSCVRDLTINDKLWFLAGDIIVTDDENTWAMFFNKDIVEKYATLTSPYDLVNEGNWTLDTMYEMIQEVQTMHGATMSFDPDVGDEWGLVGQSLNAYAFMLGAGQPMVTNNGDTITMRIQEEVNYAAFNKVFEILTDGAHVGVADFFGAWNSGVYDDQSTIFCNGNALFMPATIATVSSEKLREAEIRYGLLPMPKLDADQDDYTTSVNVYWCNVLSVPKSNTEKLDATCYALEAMAYYGMQIVTPEFYDRTLTYKRVQDEESAEMLDLIFRNRTYDLGAIFDFSGGRGEGSGMLYFYTNLLMSKQNTIVSSYESYATAFQASIDELLNAVSGNE